MLKNEVGTRKKRLTVFVAMLFVLGGIGIPSLFAQSAERVIIDTDPGTDDALAILLALNSPEVKVEALTIVAGNVTAQMGLDNALKVASLAGRCDIPIAGG